jgi:hippurate hydrolase
MQNWTKWRQFFHRHPETSFKEFNTQQKLKEILASMNINNVKECAGTGLVADIQGTAPPSGTPLTIAYRADTDALCMEEANHHLEYRSQNPGAAHMCGHDGHMACLLAGVDVISRSLDRIPSDKVIRILFQPAEEIGSGANKMIEEGCLEGVDEVYGMHNIPTLPLGAVYCPNNAIMASMDVFEITVHGKGGHGAYPYRNTDVVLAGSSIVTALHAIIPLEINCHDAAVLTVCTFESGTAANVMSDTALLKGSIRTFDPEVRALLNKRLIEVAELTAKRHRCEAKIIIHDRAPPLINHHRNATLVREAAEKMLGADMIHNMHPSSASEDFGCFLLQKPGAFFFMGTEVSEILHSSSYNFNDAMIPYAAKVWVGLTEELLKVELDKSLLS